jgi:hypothetical protein
MATRVETIELPANIRVALVIERGRIRPVWFEEIGHLGRGRVFIREVCMIWDHQEGAAKIINFSVTDGANTYRLSLNTRDFTWRYAISEETPYPSY